MTSFLQNRVWQVLHGRRGEDVVDLEPLPLDEVDAQVLVDDVIGLRLALEVSPQPHVRRGHLLLLDGMLAP